MRFPGGTLADTQFLVDNEALMRSVLGAYGYPEGDPQKFATFWTFLDFCRAGDFTPIYQVNALLYCDNTTVYQMLGPTGIMNNPLVVRDTSKRNAAATALTALVNQVRSRGFTVEHWELGNEEYGWNITASDYADLAVKFTHAIHAADPEAMVWITLGDSVHSSWSQSLLSQLRSGRADEREQRGLYSPLRLRRPYQFHGQHGDVLRLQGPICRDGIQPGRFRRLQDLTPRFGCALQVAQFLISVVPVIHRGSPVHP